MVIGLGRFGAALALELVEQDIEVLGIDRRPKIVQDLAPNLTHVVVADSTDEQALRQLPVHEFDRVVIGIGNDVEASILTASLVLQLGVNPSGRPHRQVRARSDRCGREVPGRDFTYATENTVLCPDDLIIVSGTHHDIAKFSELDE